MAPPALAPEALAWFSAYSFPGNVRELKNLIERSLIASGGKSIDRKHVQGFASPSAAAPALEPRRHPGRGQLFRSISRKPRMP